MTPSPHSLARPCCTIRHDDIPTIPFRPASPNPKTPQTPQCNLPGAHPYYAGIRTTMYMTKRVRWCSWLSRQSNTLKVSSSSLDRIMWKLFPFLLVSTSFTPCPPLDTIRGQTCSLFCMIRNCPTAATIPTQSSSRVAYDGRWVVGQELDVNIIATRTPSKGRHLYNRHSSSISHRSDRNHNLHQHLESITPSLPRSKQRHYLYLASSNPPIKY